jgi:hypothetical protein
LYREFYEIKFGAINLKFFDRIIVICRTCGNYYSLPEIIARKLFKKGLNPDRLMYLTKDFILRSWILTHFSVMWSVFLLILVFFTSLIIFRFYTDNVITSEPERISVEEGLSQKYQGKIVKVYGTVDFTLSQAKIKTTIVNGVKTEEYEEVYFPIFSNNNQKFFILVRGGNNEIQSVRSRENIQSQAILKNQNYELIGKIMKTDSLGNNDLVSKYNADLESSGYSPSSVIISSVDNISIEEFLNRYINSYLILMSVFIGSIVLQIYIDKKIS